MRRGGSPSLLPGGGVRIVSAKEVGAADEETFLVVVVPIDQKTCKLFFKSKQ
jgi:hypothetical protein